MTTYYSKNMHLLNLFAYIQHSSFTFVLHEHWNKFFFLSDFLLYNYSDFWYYYRSLLYYGQLKIVLNRNMHFAFCWTEIKTLITDSKMENPTHSFRETNLCFSSYGNCKWKVKLWWVAAHERKKRAFFPRLFCPQEYFQNLCFIAVHIEYTFRIYILLHNKKLYLIHFSASF